jgi:uncharacterized membrane protein required for colicin V production
VSVADWVAVALIAVSAVVGLARGLIASALSAAGLVVGAIVGARLAPHLLHGGSSSPYTPLAALAGAGVLAIVLQAAGSAVGTLLRRGLRLPVLRTLDSAGGLAAGALAGAVLVWVLGAAALLFPGQPELRRRAQDSVVLRHLNGFVSPASLLNLLARIDPFPSIAGPGAGVAPPDPALLRRPGVRAAAPSVVRVLGTACGIGVTGSGWIARPGLVVTAAHVVAGETDTRVERQGSSTPLPARAVAFDVRNDVAVLAVPALRGARPLPLRAPVPGAAVAILGYPENGPFTAVPGRIGRTAVVLTEDAYGHGPVARAVTSLRATVRHGNSGGPAVDARGGVRTTVFAARIGGPGGYGVPDDPVRKALDAARGPVSTGACAG